MNILFKKVSESYSRGGGIFHFLLILLVLFVFASCESPFNNEIYKPGGTLAKPEELSAGNSTTFTFTSVAFDTPSDWVEGELMDRFLAGDALYDNPRLEHLAYLIHKV